MARHTPGTHLAFVDGDAKREHQRQLRPHAACLRVRVGCPAATPASRRRLFILGVHRGDGNHVAKVDVDSVVLPLQLGVEVLRTSVVRHPQPNNLWKSRWPYSLCPLHVEHLSDRSVGETRRRPDVVVDEHAGPDGEVQMAFEASKPIGGSRSVAGKGVVCLYLRDVCAKPPHTLPVPRVSRSIGGEDVDSIVKRLFLAL